MKNILKKLSELLSEDNGRLSSQRFILLCLTFYGMAMGVASWAHDHNVSNVVYIVFSITGLGITGKLIQKPMEKASTDTPEEKK